MKVWNRNKIETSLLKFVIKSLITIHNFVQSTYQQNNTQQRVDHQSNKITTSIHPIMMTITVTNSKIPIINTKINHKKTHNHSTNTFNSHNNPYPTTMTTSTHSTTTNKASKFSTNSWSISSTNTLNFHHHHQPKI